MNAAIIEPRTERVLVLSEIAKYLRCSEGKVRSLMQKGELTGWYRLGREYRIRFAVLQAWEAARENTPSV